MNEIGMSVHNEINALALINIRDILQFILQATDKEIEERYGCERTAVDTAEKIMNIALTSSIIENKLGGWSLKYNQPLKDSEERIDHTAYFYDRKDMERDDTNGKD